MSDDFWYSLLFFVPRLLYCFVTRCTSFFSIYMLFHVLLLLLYLDYFEKFFLNRQYIRNSLFPSKVG